MYCRNCGVELIDDNSICVNCGTSKGIGTNYCNNCAAPTDENTSFCTNCGLNFGVTSNEVVTPSSSKDNNNTQNNTYSDTTSASVTTESTYSNKTTNTPKSKIAAGLLGIFLGWLGVHRLYLGYTGIGIAQLVLGLLGFLTCGITTMISSVWGLIEGILILVGSTITTDSDGNPLGD